MLKKPIEDKEWTENNLIPLPITIKYMNAVTISMIRSRKKILADWIVPNGVTSKIDLLLSPS
jgi:hypothetical protein